MATLPPLPATSPEKKLPPLRAPFAFNDNAVEMTPPASPRDSGRFYSNRRDSVPPRKPVPSHNSQTSPPKPPQKDAVHSIHMVHPSSAAPPPPLHKDAYRMRQPEPRAKPKRDPLLEYDDDPQIQYAIARPRAAATEQVRVQNAPTTRPYIPGRSSPLQRATNADHTHEHYRGDSIASGVTADSARESVETMPPPKELPYRTAHITQSTERLAEPHMAILSSGVSNRSSNSSPDHGIMFGNPSPPASEPEVIEHIGLQYHHVDLEEALRPRKTPELEQRRHLQLPNQSPRGRKVGIRPDSTVSSISDNSITRRDSPHHNPQHARAASSHSMLSHNSSRMSFAEQLDSSYPQRPPVVSNLDNGHLQSMVGQNAALLRPEQTLDLYRQNARKTNDMGVQYEFALYLIQYANELVSNPAAYSQPTADGKSSPGPLQRRIELIKEARQTLERLANRSYPYAQYYLGDAHSSGMFGKIDNTTAFRLFVSAAKHGHAEGAYRAALSYEFGWGTALNPAKAVNFYQAAASKSHPGAMLRLGKACCFNDLGFQHSYRQGVKWLKRASECADTQYPAAPYELGLLHETGFRDLLFKDEAYTAQLFALAASLGYAEANYRLGDAYENGKLGCPKDAALSVHYYTGAAMRNHPAAMMALCGWYLVGAQPVLDKDEAEAFEWAKRAAEHGLVYAEYAVGYFTEMGIGTKRDPMEAKVWYVKAAEHGDERAKNRLATIAAITSGKDLGRLARIKKGKRQAAADGEAVDDKDCIIM